MGTKQTLRQQYLSCYWADLDQTLNKGSWEQIQQITTITTTCVQATFVLGTFVQISNISEVTGPIWIKLKIKGPGNIYNRLQLSPRHLSRQHLSWGHLSISAISQLLLAQFGSNFKQRVLGTYTTVYNCHLNICPGNICPGDICPYKQYLSCYRPYLDQTLNKGSWEYIQQITTVTMTFVPATFVLGTFVHISNISAVTGPIWIKL